MIRNWQGIRDYAKYQGKTVGRSRAHRAHRRNREDEIRHLPPGHRIQGAAGAGQGHRGRRGPDARHGEGRPDEGEGRAKGALYEIRAERDQGRRKGIPDCEGGGYSGNYCVISYELRIPANYESNIVIQFVIRTTFVISRA